VLYSIFAVEFRGVFAEQWSARRHQEKISNFVFAKVFFFLFV
jgi:hypothetical protein